ncbi:PIG-L family deacetylase [Candidatus Aerophobetes bacterium]|uniref:PIG-L family deacetylase n=1 Tax=Aerophobetes bacterium TaxID=2030807 RepID=A0A497E548_UNCAE|nr:MAG: PIG-L family deacetylase [Candidatus Aerophobetes bacterium]
MSIRSVKILVFGAHPDDCDIKAGGFAIKHAQLGNKVRFVSVTNGDTGHYRIGGASLARRRYKEAQKAARIAGIEYKIYDIHNGQLLPTLENRLKIVEEIREFQADLVLTHRPNDYHPDHRYTSQLVQDAAYTVTVPNVCALTPHLMQNPVMAYVADDFQKPYPFSPDIVISIDDVVDKKLDMLHCHESQFYEWLPYNENILEQVPKAPEERKRWLKERMKIRFRKIADKYRALLKKRYGDEAGSKVLYAEAFEICEYGGKLTEEKRKGLFPF